MSITITNLPSFIEIPGRRRQWQSGAFDTLTVTLMGPQSARDQWVPSLWSAHREYPQMLVSDIQDVEQDGALVTISITYKGRFAINRMVAPILVSVKQVETSGSYQVAAQQIVNNGVVTPYQEVVGGRQIPAFKVVGKTIKIGTITHNVRYLSKSVTVKYQSTFRVIAPQMYDTASPLAGYTILSDDFGPVAGENQVDNFPIITVSATHSFPLTCTDLSVDQVSVNMFDVSETWEYKYFSQVQTTVAGVTTVTGSG